MFPSNAFAIRNSSQKCYIRCCIWSTKDAIMDAVYVKLNAIMELRMLFILLWILVLVLGRANN